MQCVPDTDKTRQLQAARSASNLKVHPVSAKSRFFKTIFKCQQRDAMIQNLSKTCPIQRASRKVKGVCTPELSVYATRSKILLRWAPNILNDVSMYKSILRTTEQVNPPDVFRIELFIQISSCKRQESLPYSRFSEANPHGQWPNLFTIDTKKEEAPFCVRTISSSLWLPTP